MRRRLCAAVLTLEAVVLGLTTPVLISVQEVDTATALWIGLGLAVVSLVTAGMLRRDWAYGLGWLVQLAAIALGIEITAMFVLGAVFLSLYWAAFVLGTRIDEHQRRVALHGEQQSDDSGTGTDDRQETGPVAPAAWDHELHCDDDTWRPHAARALRETWRGPALWGTGLCVVVGLLVLVLAEGARLVGGVLVSAVVLFPLVTWWVQRSAWRSFLAPGRTFRTAFVDDRMLLEVDERLFEVHLDEAESVSVDKGLVTVVPWPGSRLDLPEEVFPADRVERVRELVARRTAGDGAGSGQADGAVDPAGPTP